MERLTFYSNDETQSYELKDPNTPIKTLVNTLGVYEDEREIFIDGLSFGDTIAHLRKKRNMTQQELSKKLKITQPNLCRFETNQRKPSPEIVSLLSTILEVPFPDLLAAYKKTFFTNAVEVGEMIETERKMRGFSIEQIAKQTRIAPKRLRRIESGKDSANWLEVLRIAKLLGSEDLKEQSESIYQNRYPSMSNYPQQ